MTKCYDCGLEYGGKSWIETSIPDKIWKRISPTGDDGGLLCISCIVRRLREIGCDRKVPIFICGTEPIVAIEGDPSDNLHIIREWDY